MDLNEHIHALVSNALRAASYAKDGQHSRVYVLYCLSVMYGYYKQAVRVRG